MRARKIALGIILFGALILCTRPLVTKPPEPEYHGFPLSFWARQFQNYRSVPAFALYTKEFQAKADARDAIRAIGTNALPLLLEWINYQPPRWHPMPPSWAPEWVLYSFGTIYDGDFRKQSRGAAASAAFQALGTDASPAIPSLATMLTNYNRPLPAYLATDSLSYLGTQALPYLVSARSNCPAQQRQQIAQAIAVNLVPVMRDKSSLPFLLKALLDGDETLRTAATNAICRIAPELLTNTPAK